MENTISPSLKPSQSPPHTGSVDVAGSPKGGNIKLTTCTTSSHDIKTNDHNRRTVVKKSKTPKAITTTTTITTINNVNSSNNTNKISPVNASRKQRSQTVIVTPPQDHCYIKQPFRKRSHIRKSNSKSPPIAIKSNLEAPPSISCTTPPRPQVIVNNTIQQQQLQPQLQSQPQLQPIITQPHNLIHEKIESPSICISDTEEKEFDNDVQVVEHPYIENYIAQQPISSPSPLSNLPIKKRRKLSLYEENPYSFGIRPKTNQLSYPSQKLYKMFSIADFIEYDMSLPTEEQAPPPPQIQPNFIYSPSRNSYQRKPYYSPNSYPRYHSPEPVVNVTPTAIPQPYLARRNPHIPVQHLFEDFNGVITEEERIHITNLIRCGNYNFTDKVLGNYIMNRRRLQAVDFNLCYNCNDLCGNGSGVSGNSSNNVSTSTTTSSTSNCQCRNRHYNLRNLREANNAPPTKVEALKATPRAMKRSFSTGPGVVTSPRIDLLANELRPKSRNYGTTHPKKVTASNNKVNDLFMLMILISHVFSIILSIFNKSAIKILFGSTMNIFLKFQFERCVQEYIFNHHKNSTINISGSSFNIFNKTEMKTRKIYKRKI